jgi:hypothetical protein
MGNGAEALKFYRRFLKDAPNAPNRAIAEKHIKDLEDATPRGTPPPTPPPSSSTPPVAPAPVTAPTEPPVAPLPSSPTSAGPGLSPTVNSLGPTSTSVSTTPTVENGAPPSQSESHPIYSRWWFWAGVGAVVVGGIILIAAEKRDPSCQEGFTCH